MNKLGKVILHEFKMVAANKAFVILTILGPFLLAAVAVLPSLLSVNSEVKDVRIAIVGASSEFFQQIEEPLKSSGIIIQPSTAEKEQLDTLVLEGDLYGYLVLPEDLPTVQKLTLYTRELTDYKILGPLQGTIGRIIIRKRLIQAGFDPELIQRLYSSPQVEAVKLSRKGEKVESEKQDFMTAMLTGVAFTMMLYMTILIYGQSIGRSVLNEKVSKTVEILLSSISPLELLFGKILGQVMASLLQYAVWIGMGFAFISIIGPVIGVSGIPQIPLSLVGYLLIFFLLGFFLYSSIYAAFGAVSQDESNFGQLSWPLIVFLVIPMVSVGGIISSPNSPVFVFLSLFPMTGAIVTFIRMVVTTLPSWQIAVSIALQAVSVAVMVFLSAKIFRVGILMTGKRLKVKEILRWLKV
jgi:ABC-2 type transport system permease protein